jgi:SAM-dependent methyltransferase
MKNLDRKVKEYHKKFYTKISYSVPNETIFRLLGNKKIIYKNKNILDIGIGYGDNLLEFKRRGANIFGIDIRKEIIKAFVIKNRLNSKNFFHSDLNNDFPQIKKKMDLIVCKDTIYYLTLDRQFVLFDEVNKILKKKGFFLIQYIQYQMKERKKKSQFSSFSIDLKSNYRMMKNFFEKRNPLPFLKEKHIKKLITSQHFKLVSNIFDINTHTLKRNKIITVNRFFLLQKKI